MCSETPFSQWRPRHLENEINSSFTGKREFILPGIRPRLCEGEVSKTSVTDRRSKDDPRDLLREMKTSKELSQTFEVKFKEYNNKH